MYPRMQRSGMKRQRNVAERNPGGAASPRTRVDTNAPEYRGEGQGERTMNSLTGNDLRQSLGKGSVGSDHPRLMTPDCHFMTYHRHIACF